MSVKSEGEEEGGKMKTSVKARNKAQICLL